MVAIYNGNAEDFNPAPHLIVWTNEAAYALALTKDNGLVLMENQPKGDGTHDPSDWFPVNPISRENYLFCAAMITLLERMEFGKP